MKTACKVILIGALMMALMSFAARAYEEEYGEYIVSGDGEEYLLIACTDGEVREIFRATQFSRIIDYINSLDIYEVRINFTGVSISENVELKGRKYVFYGSLSFSDSASLMLSDAELVLSNAMLSFEKGSLRIKSGRAYLEGGEISADFCAVRLDYSSDAVFYLKSGIVSAEKTAVRLDYGICIISGGEVKSTSEAAIESKSTLVLSGMPKIVGREYGILTSSPITLSYEESAFSSSVAVCYSSTFDVGSIKCVFYEADEISLKNISFYDSLGQKYELRYFEEHKMVDEKRFGAVYLPFNVNFYCANELVKTEEAIHGDVIKECDAKEKSGYKFSSWSTDSSSEIPYDFAQNVNNSFDLYAKYTLLPPSFILNSFEFTYDTFEHEFGIEELSHPLLSEGLVNYTWYRDGEYVSNAGPQINVSDVNDSGSYKCKINFTLGVDSVSITTPAVEVKIHKQKVNIPLINDKYYTGVYQAPELYSTAIYTVSAVGGTLVGIYPIKITLCDPNNYEFEDGGAVAFAEFKVLKAENRFTDGLRVADIYEGMTPNPLAAACFGEVEYLYSDEYGSGYTNSPPTAPGVYYCVAYVPGCENYTELYSAPVLFSVTEERPVGISIESMPNRCEYSAFDAFDPTGLCLKITYNSKREVLVGADKLSFSYQSANAFRYGDSAVIVSYQELSVAVSVTVQKAKYDLSQVSFSDTALVYDGSRKTMSFIGTLPTGLDGIELGYSVLGGGIDAGVYPMTLSFYSNSPNYESPQSITATLTVLPYESEVVFADTEFVYDGSLKCPVAYYTDVYGRKISAEVSGARSLAGEYTAEAFCHDKNYKLLNFRVTYNIAKADYDLSSLSWSYSDFTYDGEEKSVTVSGLPSGVSVIGYSDNKATSAGKYVARVTLDYDEKNYNAPSGIFCEWEIMRADYDTSLFSFLDSEHIYNGAIQYPELSGAMPVGADGISLEYRFSRGAAHVGEGRVAVEISFFSTSENYNLPENVYAYVEILPLGISAVWQHTEFTYNGNSHAPTATAIESQLTVIGAARDAGTYTATAISLNTDYYVTNANTDFIINQAENRWLVPLFIENVYEGIIVSPRCQAMAGEVIFIYYSDAEAKCEIDMPSSPGKYYVRALCDGDRNHKSIASESLSFEIIKVVPTKLHISMNRFEFSAFDALDFSDFSIKVENNDGSCFSPMADTVKVGYAAADSLRFGDSWVSISYMGITEEIEITVRKAEYDMSGVSWSESTFEYDGDEKRITLLGLPEGISVKSYFGGVGKYAGEYPASADLEYDVYNYNPPMLPEGVLKIRKRKIEPPALDSLVYNGSEQYPNVSKSELYSVVTEPGRAVGAYAVSLALSDPENYEFQGGISSITVYYEIEPRKITLRVLDLDKYLFESMDEPNYRIEDGYVLDGDELHLCFVYTDDEISCVSDNPNYSVTVIPGVIIKHNSLSDDGIFLAFLILLVILTLTFVCVVTVRHRERIFRYVSILKCRLSPIEYEAEYTEVKTPDEEAPSDFPEHSQLEEETEIFDAETESEESHTEAANGGEVTLEAYSSVENALYVDKERADELITDSLAKNLLSKNDCLIETVGTKKRVINVDTLSENFSSGDTVDVNILKNRSLVPYDTAYIKVLARGMIDKPLKVYANDFSLSAVKMIALKGGEAIRVITVKKKDMGQKNSEKP